ncbi:MAG: 30S ribosomal protein S8 [Clostridiales bacterium]|nr:30S ribosomal protein S8 [Clostridiales bacterium]
MVTTDPIADLLTRIRNAITARHETVSIPASKMKKSIVDILVNEGFVASSEIVEDKGHSNIKVVLKYSGNTNAITNLKRISKPGLRVYCGSDNLPKVLGGYGIAIISTSRGVMTDKKARELKIGGEVLAYVW